MTLGRVLLDSAVRVTALLLLAMAAAGSLRSRAASARRGVWTAALLLSLAMPLLAALLPRLPVEIPPRVLRGAVSFLHRDGGRSGPRAGAALPGARGGRGSGRNVPDGVWPDGDALAISIESSILAIWAIGALALAIRAGIGGFKAARLARRASPATLPAVASALAELSLRLRIRAPVRLLASLEIGAPAVVGVLRPAILLPPGHDRWSPAQARAVVAHELSHVAGRDCLALAVARLACALYWFHPLVWIAARRLSAERERACDDQVLAAGVSAPDYAAFLLGMARAWRAFAPVTGEALAMARPSELEGRLLAILDPGRRLEKLTRRARLLLAIAVAAVAIPVGALSPRVEGRPARFLLPEPDILGDDVASFRSEIVPGSEREATIALDSAALSGLDAAAVRRLLADAARPPRDETDLVPARARWALGRLRDGRLTEPLLESLGDADWRIQAYAAWALARTGDPRAVPPLLPLLRHTAWRARAMAAFALAQLRDPRAAEPMRAALEDPAWQVRTCAVDYFGALGDRSFLSEIEPLLSDRHMAVRASAADAVAALSP